MSLPFLPCLEEGQRQGGGPLNFSIPGHWGLESPDPGPVSLRSLESLVGVGGQRAVAGPQLYNPHSPPQPLPGGLLQTPHGTSPARQGPHGRRCGRSKGQPPADLTADTCVATWEAPRASPGRHVPALGQAGLGGRIWVTATPDTQTCSSGVEPDLSRSPSGHLGGAWPRVGGKRGPSQLGLEGPRPDLHILRPPAPGAGGGAGGPTSH